MELIRKADGKHYFVSLQAMVTPVNRSEPTGVLHYLSIKEFLNDWEDAE